MFKVLVNLFLMVPFGIFLRYYFKCNLKKTVLFTFLLSLFFELTQLTGLYFIYPNAYRLFDVDDLIVNTLGGMFGYILTPLFTKLLPSKEELDLKSYKKGFKVSSTKRIITFMIDIVLLLLIIGSSRAVFCNYNRWKIGPIDRMEVVDYLLSNGYSYGYATFWNANVFTELSDGSKNDICFKFG